MTSQLLTELIQSMALLSVFLLIGTFIRAKVKLFQKTFIPASVIGGFLLLLLGPIVSNILPVPQSWITTYSLIPGILIIPIVASVPLGLKLGGSKSGEGNGNGGLKSILPLFCIMGVVAFLQYVVGFGTNIAFKAAGYEIYDAFGWELGMGYSGGHGTAGLLGSMYRELNLPYWELSQGIAVTTATIGLIGGIVIGMVLINWAARKGYTSILKKPGDIPENMKLGYEKDIKKQGSLGRETMMSSSIDTFAFHLAIILTACGIAYLLLVVAKKFAIPGLSSISIWAYAIVVMFGIWGIIQKLKIDYLVDSKIKGKISGTLTEYAIIAAIASLPVEAVLTHMAPILTACVVGMAATIFPFLFLCKKFLRDNWFEHMIAAFGMSTGVFLTGLLLLRICDPEMESPVLGNYSLSYTLLSVLNFAIMPILLNIIVNKGAIAMFMVSLAFCVVYLIGAIISSKIVFREKGVAVEEISRRIN